MFLRPFGLYRNACFGILFLSNLCTCCSHFFWYCFISFTVFCAPVFSLMQWFFSLSHFVIPSKCLKNVICAASKRCSSLFLGTQASLPNFNAALAVMLWIFNFVSLSHSSAQIFSSAPYPQSTFLPQCEWPSFTPIQNNRQNYSSVYFNIIFLDSKLEDKKFSTAWQQAFPDLNLPLISSWIEFRSTMFVPKYLDCSTLSKELLPVFTS